MTLADLLRLTRRRIGSIIVCTILGVLAAVGILWITPVTYTAGSTAYVRVSLPSDDGTETSANAYYSASQLASQKVKAFVSVFTSETVAQGVIDELGLSETPTELAKDVTASNATNSLTISVTATASTPDLARKISDAVVTQSAAQVKLLEGASSPVEVVLMAPSNLSTVTKSPSVPKYVAAGLLAGLLLGYMVAFARQYFDRKIRTVDDIAERVDVPVVGVLPDSATIARSDVESKDFRAEESLRKLRTNLRYANVDSEMRVILVTSPLQGDGKSSVASSLAKVMALAGQDVLLIDADLRRPTVRETFGASGSLGLTQVLVGSVGLDKAIIETPVPGLSVLPAGEMPPNPSELLGSQRMSELLEYLGQQRVVIIDAPPVLPVTDAAVLSKSVDGIVLVLQAGRTTDEQLEQSLLQLEQADGNVVGLILNKAASSKLARMRYGDSEYGYGYKDSEYGYRRKKGESVAATVSSAGHGRVAAPEAREASIERRSISRAQEGDTPTSHRETTDSTDMQGFFEEIGVTTPQQGNATSTRRGGGQQPSVHFPPVRARKR